MNKDNKDNNNDEDDDVKSIDFARLKRVFTDLSLQTGDPPKSSSSFSTVQNLLSPSEIKIMLSSVARIPDKIRGGWSDYRRTWSGGIRGDNWVSDEEYYRMLGEPAPQKSSSETLPERGVFGQLSKNIDFLKKSIRGDPPLASSTSEDDFTLDNVSKVASEKAKALHIPTLRSRFQQVSVTYMQIAKSAIVEFIRGYKEGREEEYKRGGEIYFRGWEEELPPTATDQANNTNLGKNIEVIRSKIKDAVDGFEGVNTGDLSKIKSDEELKRKESMEKILDDVDRNIDKNLDYLREEGSRIVDMGREEVKETVKKAVDENYLDKNIEFIVQKGEQIVDDGKKRFDELEKSMSKKK